MRIGTGLAAKHGRIPRLRRRKRCTTRPPACRIAPDMNRLLMLAGPLNLMQSTHSLTAAGGRAGRCLRCAPAAGDRLALEC